MAYKRNKNIIVTFSCECGGTLVTKNMNNTRCTRCGRYYCVHIGEYTHERIWVNDIVAPVDSLNVPKELREEIKQLIKDRLFKVQTSCSRCMTIFESGSGRTLCDTCDRHVRKSR